MAVWNIWRAACLMILCSFLISLSGADHPTASSEHHSVRRRSAEQDFHGPLFATLIGSGKEPVRRVARSPAPQFGHHHGGFGGGFGGHRGFRGHGGFHGGPGGFHGGPGGFHGGGGPGGCDVCGGGFRPGGVSGSFSHSSSSSSSGTINFGRRK